MERRWEEEIVRYTAMGDDGELHTVIEYQTIIEVEFLSGEKQRTRGLKRLALSDGRHLNWIDDNTFEIVEAEEIIRKV